jgi:hypothetical protein
MGNSKGMKQRLYHLVLPHVITISERWKHSIKLRAKIV